MIPSGRSQKNVWELDALGPAEMMGNMLINDSRGRSQRETIWVSAAEHKLELFVSPFLLKMNFGKPYGAPWRSLPSKKKSTVTMNHSGDYWSDCIRLKRFVQRAVQKIPDHSIISESTAITHVFNERVILKSGDVIEMWTWHNDDLTI